MAAKLLQAPTDAAPTLSPAERAEQAQRAAFLAYCAGVADALRLTLTGTDAAILQRCLAKAQAKRCARELLTRDDGRLDLAELNRRMSARPDRADQDMARAMLGQVRRWRACIQAALPGVPDAARVQAIASGRCALIAAQLMDSGWFTRRTDIAPAARAYGRELLVNDAGTYERKRADRERSGPTPGEDLFAARERADLA